MTVLEIDDARDLVRLEHGTLHPSRRTLFSVMRNEIGFLPAWLDHHRRIGFGQFLIWDDRSDDGTAEFLAAQPDCVVLRSDRRYGDALRYRDPDGAERDERFGIYFKIALPRAFLPGAYVAYVDADEFLLLPPGVADIAEVVARLEVRGAASAMASVVEFFPASAADMTGPLPETLGGLLNACPYFEAEPLVRLREGASPEFVGPSKTARLFDRYGIAPRLERRGWHRVWMPRKAKDAQRFQKSPRHKTPILRHDVESWLAGTHNANRPPTPDVLLCVAHFVFTSQFAEKIDRAIAWGAHANAAAKYRYYAALLEKMRGVPDGFLDARSTRYEDPAQLVAAGLMRW